MKKNAVILSLLILLVIIIGLSSVSCSEKISKDEIKDILVPLLEKSEELNVIYFGEGLPMTVDREDAERFYSSFESEVKAINYHPVDKSCGYESEADIREATLEVFTPEYSEFLFNRAFIGISDVVNDGTGDVTQTSSYARYLEQNGMLTVRIDLSSEAIKLGREYDVDSLEIIRQKENYVLVTIPTQLDGKSCDVELKIVNTKDGWRLDSPTY